MPDGRKTALSPEQAVDRLEALHAEAVRAQRDALARFAAGGAPPDPAERRHFRYPELRLIWAPSGPMPFTRRAWGKLQTPGIYATTVTQPGFFRPLSARATAAAGRGIRCLHPGARQRPGDAIPLRARSRRRTRPQRRHAGRAGTTFPRALAVGGRRRGGGRTVDVRRGAASTAGVVRCGAGRLLAASPAALHRHRLAQHPAVDPADQLSALCRSVRALGPGRAGATPPARTTV